MSEFYLTFLPIRKRNFQPAILPIEAVLLHLEPHGSANDVPQRIGAPEQRNVGGKEHDHTEPERGRQIAAG